MSSFSGKPTSELGIETLSNGLRNLFPIYKDEKNGVTLNKPDFRELEAASPTTTTTSSSSSGSVGPNPRKPHSTRSGELSVESSPLRPGHTRSRSCGSHHLIFSGSVSSPPPATVAPTGNICPSGRISKTGLPGRVSKPEVLGSGSGRYGHGSIMRGGDGGAPRGLIVGGGGVRSGVDPEELKRLGNDCYKNAQFSEALSLYDRAIAISPANAAYRFNRAAALMGLRRLLEAVRECEAAIRLDPAYVKAHHRLGSLLLSLGQVESAREHICFPGHQPDPVEMHKLQLVEKHLGKCGEARRIGDWRGTLSEVDAAIAAGADASPQLFACRAEALLKLHQLDDAFSAQSNIRMFEASVSLSPSLKIFGMLVEAYLFFVRAQVELAKGRYDSALTAIEKAGKIDPHNAETSKLLNTVRLVCRARARGNDLFKSERFTEACSAYGEGLRLDPSNSVLCCNRAACWFKLGQWERSVDDCNQALRIQPNYLKALLRRALSNSKLERWSEAVRDYEVLRRELPDDNEVAESLFHAQVALKKSLGEDVYNVKFGGDVESVSGLEQFRAAISSSGKRSHSLNSIICWWPYGYVFIGDGNKCRCVRGPFQIRDQSTMQAHISVRRCFVQPVSVHQFSPGKQLLLLI
ncbi:hypothetical protein SASPL_117946 [Salvia splendens]|uniref:DnaJ-like protein subfamily C member 7 n=1 Tax=Salvia splendens TaxID=180675 RepID=A0A8X8XVU9_SALSN|nr:hypothetical protein SASPL_117946 [Salvia splendens]